MDEEAAKEAERLMPQEGPSTSSATRNQNPPVSTSTTTHSQNPPVSASPGTSSAANRTGLPTESLQELLSRASIAPGPSTSSSSSSSTQNLQQPQQQLQQGVSQAPAPPFDGGGGELKFSPPRFGFSPPGPSSSSTENLQQPQQLQQGVSQGAAPFDGGGDLKISPPRFGPSSSSTDNLQQPQQLQQGVSQAAAPFDGGGGGGGDLVFSPPRFGSYRQPPPTRRFNSLAEAFGIQEEPVQPPQQQQHPQPLPSIASCSSSNNTGNMSNPQPIPSSPLASPQSQMSQSFEGMAPSPFPPHMQQYGGAHASPVPMSPAHNSNMPRPSPGMSPGMAPGSVGGPGMYPQPPTPQRPTMPQGMPMTPGGSVPQMGAGPPGTPGGQMTPMPMTPTTQQQQQMMMQQVQPPGQPTMMQQQGMGGGQGMQQMQPGMQPNPPMMMGMPPQQMMMQGPQGQQYGYPQPGQAWMQQPQMMHAQYARKPQMMGAPGQRVMIQRVPYAAPGYPPGTVPPQQQTMPTGAQYGRPMPPQYPTTPGAPPPGYGYPAGTMQQPQQQQPAQQMAPGYSPAAAMQQQPVPPSMQAVPGPYVTPPYPQQQAQQVQQQRTPVQQQQAPQQMPMRPYMQSPQAQMMAGQQPVYPPSTGSTPQQQQQQQPLGTPQTPYTPSLNARFPPGTPTSSPLHGTPQQLQQPGSSTGPTPQTPGTPQQLQQQPGLQPDMRSPQLMSPSQAQMMQQQQQQPAMHPTARQMSNGDLQHMRPPQPMQQQQMVVAVPPPQMPTGGPYMARDPGVAAQLMLHADMWLVGCHFVVVDWERYCTEKTDMMALRNRIRSYGGEIDFGLKIIDMQRTPYTHLIVTHFAGIPQLPPRAGIPPCDPLLAMIKEGKRVVTMQWLLDVVERESLEVPWRIAHLPIPHQTQEQQRFNAGRIIAVTGFTNDERAAVKYMVEAMGAKMMAGLAEHTHLLVAKHPSGEKYEAAREWGVPVVNLQWLVDAYIGAARLEMEHPRYQVSHQNPIEVNVGSFLECMHEQFKNCLAPWRYPIGCTQQEWDKAVNIKHQMANDEHVYPLKTLKRISSPAPTEEEIAAAHAAAPPSPEIAKEIVVAFEGFDDEFTDALKRKVRYLGGGVTKFVERCTHLVCIDGKRTERLLQGLLLGKYLVSAGWVNASYNFKFFADTLDFLLRDDETEKMYGCNFRMSILRARRKGVFDDIDFYITPSVEPSVEVVKNLCVMGGGEVHEDPPTAARILECLEWEKPYIIITTECDMPILKYLTDCECTVYNTEMVFSAAMRQEVEPHPAFIVNPNACQPAPLRLPSCAAAAAPAATPAAASAAGAAASAANTAASTPSRRTSSGQTPPQASAAAAAVAATSSSPEFASPQTPRVKANC